MKPLPHYFVMQILFSTCSQTLVAASRTDERVFFLQSENPEWSQLQLLGFALMKDLVLSLAWDIHSKGATIFVF